MYVCLLVRYVRIHLSLTHTRSKSNHRKLRGPCPRPIPGGFRSAPPSPNLIFLHEAKHFFISLHWLFISLFSSISNLFYGQINFILALPVIILMVLGVIIGVNYSTKIKQSLVKNTTGYGLIITGIFISTMILLEN